MKEYRYLTSSVNARADEFPLTLVADVEPTRRPAATMESNISCGAIADVSVAEYLPARILGARFT